MQLFIGARPAGALALRSRHQLVQACASSAKMPCAPVESVDVVLISGGVESSVLLRQRALAVGTRSIVQPVFFDYSQRAAAQEAESSLRQANAASRANRRVRPLMTLDLSSVGGAMRELTKSRAHVPIPHRNLVLLSLCVSLGSQLREGVGAPPNTPAAIYIALSADDASWYPSASPGFLLAFRGVVKALDGALDVHAPLSKLSKEQIVLAGCKAGIVWADTFSCMIGVSSSEVGDVLVHCGRCPQCRARKAAFDAADVQIGAHGTYRR
jgi:7-cyano-7-deazaguanine synthase